jgi:hypothetical protein
MWTYLNNFGTIKKIKEAVTGATGKRILIDHWV